MVKSASDITYDDFVQPRLNLAQILLSGNIAWNRPPILSVDMKLKLLTANLRNHKTSSFRLSSPGKVIARAFEVDGVELFPD